MSQDPDPPQNPEPQNPDGYPQQPEPEESGAPAPNGHHSSRTGALWAATTVSIILLILLIIFILQNSAPASIVYFGLEGSVPLGVALLIAAVAGAAVVAIAGIARIAHLRLNERRARRHQPARSPRRS